MSLEVKTKVDRRILVILGIATILFGSFGGLVLFKQPHAWQLPLVIAAFLGAFWVGALSVRFQFDESEICYRSIFRRFAVPVAAVRSVRIVSERKKNAPQGVPRFYLSLDDGRQVALNVKILPLEVVRQLCGMLEAKGATVVTEDSFAARRMVSQIFGTKR